VEKNAVSRPITSDVLTDLRGAEEVVPRRALEGVVEILIEVMPLGQVGPGEGQDEEGDQHDEAADRHLAAQEPAPDEPAPARDLVGLVLGFGCEGSRFLHDGHGYRIRTRGSRAA
jgi:hypothetical protein